MPTRPRVFVPPGFQTARARRAPDRRASATARGYDYRWQKFAKQFLEDPAHRLCAVCLANGKTEPATQVDHIVPFARGGEKYDVRNCQGLCDIHHAQKTRRGE